MRKAEIKALLLGTSQVSPSLSQSSFSSDHKPTLPSLTAAINNFKESIDKVHEAQGRQRVLERQLQKQKSTTINAQSHSDYADYIRQTADLDKYLQQWNATNKNRKIDHQSFLNRQSRRRIKDNIDNSRSFFHSNNAYKRQTLKEESQQYEQYIRESQEELSSSLIKQRRRSQKEERYRQAQIAAFHERKQQQVRNEKQRQIRQLFSHSLSNHNTINNLAQRNHSLKNKRYKEIQLVKKLNTSQLPINLASTIKNPQIYAK